METESIVFSLVLLGVGIIVSMSIGAIISLIIWLVIDSFLVIYWEKERAKALSKYDSTILTREMADQIVVRYNPDMSALMNSRESYFILLWAFIQVIVWILTMIGLIITRLLS